MSEFCNFQPKIRASCSKKLIHFSADILNFFRFKPVEHGQTQQTVAFVGRVLIFSVEPAKAQTRGRRMQRHIVEHRQNSVVGQVLQESRSRR